MKKPIGKGKQGVVFSAYDAKTNTRVAIKIVDKKSQSKSESLDEIEILNKLNKLPNLVGFPKIISTSFKRNYYFVTELLGDSLKDIQKKFHATRGMRLKHAYMIGIQLLQRIRDFHSIGYVHGDIKPGNIVFGRGRKHNLLYLIDYGLAKVESRSCPKSSPTDIYLKENLRLNGTPLYASINSHLGWNKIFKKDDIESFIYMLINITKGSLPWFNLPVLEGDNYSNILNAKIQADADDMCKGLPGPIKDIYIYVRNLENLEEIDYDYINECLYKAASSNEKTQVSKDHFKHKFHWLLEEKNNQNGSHILRVKRLQSMDSLLDRSDSDDLEIRAKYINKSNLEESK